VKHDFYKKGLIIFTYWFNIKNNCHIFYKILTSVNYIGRIWLVQKKKNWQNH